MHTRAVAADMTRILDHLHHARLTRDPNRSRGSDKLATGQDPLNILLDLDPDSRVECGIGVAVEVMDIRVPDHIRIAHRRFLSCPGAQGDGARRDSRVFMGQV